MASSERFGYEWNKFTKIDHEDEIQFLKWVYPLKKEDFKGKVVLDAGCGMGKNAYWILEYGAKKLIGFDYDKRTVKSAIRNLSKFKNYKIIYKSIYEIDFEIDFDIAISIGVVHHLEDPKKAIYKLIDSVKKNGTVSVWVYGYEGNEWIVRYINPIRRITSKLPLGAVNFITYFLSIPLWIYLRLPQSHPYFKQLADFRFKHIHQIAFDQLIPTIANYWKKEEVLELFNYKKLKNVRIFRVNKNSWTVIGVKK